MGNIKQKATDEEIIAAYKKTNNVWKAGDLLGMSGQSVHSRLVAAKVPRNNPIFTEAERRVLASEYQEYRDSGRLIELAEKMGRTKPFLCRKAREMGLTDQGRPYKRKKSNYSHPIGEDSPRWLGGVTKNNQAVFDTYAPKIMFVDEVRRMPSNGILLETKCAYCGKWFAPSMQEVSRRHATLNKGLDARIYCSDKCKKECPIYRKIKYQAGFRQSTSREVVPLLRQMVFSRDDWRCQRCGSTGPLHCHHIKSYSQNKILANDPDNCITFCKACHKQAHREAGCTGKDLKCKR